MAPNATPQISLMEKLDMFPAIAQTIGAFIYGLIVSPFRGSSGAYTYWQHAAFTAVRTNMGRISIAQAAWMNPTTEQLYHDLCKKNGVQPDIVNLPSGAAGYWIGSKEAKNILVYYHGGGYVLHSVPGQYQLADHIRSSLKKAGKDVSIFWLDYTLAPEKHYPTQLAQAIEILKYALSTGRKPSDIMIGGDSAGGNLTVAVLSHLMHPHPDSSVERLELEGPLRGAVLISPWVSFDTSFPSCTTNLQKDYCPPGVVKRFGATWRGDAPQDNYNEPFVAPKEWWTDLPAKVQDILITIGGLELAADAMTGFAGKVEENHKGTTTVVLRNEYHVAPAIDTYIGIRRESETSKAIVSWLIERF